MDKFKAVSIALLVVSIVCIVLVANAAVVGNQLNLERQKSVQLKVQVSNLETRLKAIQDSTANIQRELDSVRARLDQEVRVSQDLRNALANEQTVAQNLRIDLDRINNELAAAQTPKETTAPQPTVTQ